MKFRDEYAFLSNFYPVKISYKGIVWPSAEHAFQAAKTNDPNEKLAILQATTPGQAKRLGRKVTLRPEWDSIKVAVMREIVFRKFFDAENGLYKKLISIWDEIVEENEWGDTFWGVCNGVGSNHLGKILMDIRARIWETPLR